MKYKALLIDIDDTLLDFRYGEKFALKPVFDNYHIPYNDDNIELYNKINLAYWHRHELEECDHQTVLDSRWVDFFNEFNMEINPDEVNDIYMKSLATVAFLIPNAKEFLDNASKIMDIYYVSNGEPYVQYPRLKVAGIDKYAKDIFISDEIKASKPNKQFFDIVLNRTGLKKEECIVLGDSINSDIKGAINSCIDYVWFNPKNKENKEKYREINNLMDFFKLKEINND